MALDLQRFSLALIPSYELPDQEGRRGSRMLQPAVFYVQVRKRPQVLFPWAAVSDVDMDAALAGPRSRLALRGDRDRCIPSDHEDFIAHPGRLARVGH